MALVTSRCSTRLAPITLPVVMLAGVLAVGMGAQPEATIDLLDFINLTPGAQFGYSGLYTSSGIGVAATASTNVVSYTAGGGYSTLTRDVVFTIGGSSLTETTITAVAADALRTLRESSRTTVPRATYTFDTWTASLPRTFVPGQFYTVDEHFTYNAAGAGVTRAGSAHVGVENVTTALGTFNCLRLVIAVHETEDTTGVRITRQTDEWYARGLGLVKFKFIALGAGPGQSVTRDFTITSTNQPIVNLPAVPANPLPPVITAQPIGGWIVPGGKFLLATSATGEGTLHYQWYRDGFAVPATDEPTMMVVASGTYRMDVSNAGGAVSSASAVVTEADAPVVLAPPAPQLISPGGAALLRIAAIGRAPLAYQWQRDGVDVPGATRDFLEATVPGSYRVTVSNSAGDATSDPVAVGAAPAGAAARLENLSARCLVGTGAAQAIPGFVLAGGGGRVLVRAMGPALEPHGVSGWLAEPTLNLVRQTTGSSIAANDRWDTTDADLIATMNATGAFMPVAGSHDCALVENLSADAYTALVAGTAGTTGVALAEVYDASPAGAHLVNLSARCFVGQGDSVLIAGIVVGGQASMKVLIRAVGPTLEAKGVPGALADPEFAVFDGENHVVGFSGDWNGADALLAAATASTGAFDLLDAREAATVLSLSPGRFTIVVRGSGGAVGVALAEIYVVP